MHDKRQAIEGYEVRYVPSELRVEEIDGKTRIVGYAAVFEKDSVNFGGWIERIAKGAFDASLARKDDVRALVEHDPRWIIGRTAAGTLDLAADDTGLRMEIQPPDTTAGLDIVKSLKRGDVNQASFGFRTITDQWERTEDGKLDVRTLLEVRLFDVSPVAFPAYPDTSVAVRAFGAWRKAVDGVAQRAREREIEIAEMGA